MSKHPYLRHRPSTIVAVAEALALKESWWAVLRAIFRRSATVTTVTGMAKPGQLGVADSLGSMREASTLA
jgi:hypothetical protein